MKIGINLFWLVPGYGGLETYVRGLLSGLDQADDRNQYLLFTNPLNHGTFGHLSNRFSRRLCPLPVTSRVAWRVAEQLLTPRYAAVEKIDLLHSPADMIPLRRTCPVVVTIHDVNFYSLSDRLPVSASRLFELWVQRSARRADAIITVSEFSSFAISSQLDVALSRISVIHNAPAVRKLPSPAHWPRLAQRLGIEGDHLISFADGSPHKNLASLLKATVYLKSSWRGLQLVVIGQRARQARSVRALLDKLNLNSRVIFTGYLREDELNLVMANARLLVYPSLYEGFGLPVVEAMSMGVPVVCSNAAALPEIAGDAAMLFNPLSPVEIARAIERLITNEPLRREFVIAGRKQARRFSWERAAQQTIAVYDRVAGFKAPGSLATG
ncbi:MAG: glycosyltransferase family 4 protein [Candidatus Binataceae bacterium]|nr:glycosyltransferase family 4 protein [Candidatus Binataceae bacterium]